MNLFRSFGLTVINKCTIHIQIPFFFLNWLYRDFDWLRTNFPSLRAMSVVNATSTIIPYEDYELMSSESCGGSNDFQAESCKKTNRLKRNRRAPIRFVDKLHEICSRDDLNNIICWNDGELYVLLFPILIQDVELIKNLSKPIL